MDVTRMKALLKLGSGPGKLELVERPIPAREAGEVLVRVTAASICGSDLHIYLGELECKPGVILGHEFAGEIVRAGSDVPDWNVADRVTSELHVGACGRCYYCRHDMIPLCPSKTPPGWTSDGAFAEYIKLPARLLHHVPDSVSDPMAALTEPIACCLGGIASVGVNPGEFVVVVGVGIIGLASAAIARALGAGKVAMIGRSRKTGARLEAAQQMGFDMILDSDRDDVIVEVVAAGKGRGADLVIDAAGTEASLHIAAHATRPGGRVCAIGLSPTPSTSVPWNEMMRRRLQVGFTWSADSKSFERALSLLADGSVSFPERAIQSFPLARWREAFEALKTRTVVKAQLIT